MHKLLILVFGFLCGIARSQNLVPNPGFENFIALPQLPGEWSNCPPWSSVNNVPNVGWPYATPDYLHINGSGFVTLPNSALGTTLPHNGDAVMGLCGGASPMSAPQFREYISVQLTDLMVPGQTYTVSFWTTNGTGDREAGSSTDHFGVHFSVGPLTQAQHEPIPVTPQLEFSGQLWSADWQQHTFTITAAATWSHITIGVFLPDNMVTKVVQDPTAVWVDQVYYFVDDFVVSPTPVELSITGDTVICAGESTTLLAQNGTSYSWADAADPGQIIGTGDSIVVSPGNTTGYVVYSDGDTAEITVNVTPLPEVTVTSVSTCPDVPTELTASGADNYTWSPSAGLNTATGPVVTPAVAVTTVYMVTGTSNGCSDTALSTVTVFPFPDIVVNDLTICPGFSGLLTASGAESYSWEPAIGLNTTGGDSVIASPGETTVYTITGVQNGCAASVDVTVSVTEGLLLTVNDFQICAGGTAVLEAEGADVYTWSPDVDFFLPDGSKVTASPHATTVYTVTGTNAAGTCSGTAQSTVELIDHVGVSIQAGANPLLIENPFVTLIGEPHDEMLIWYFDDGDSAEGSSVQHLFPIGVEGVYPVMLVARTVGGCIDTAVIQIVVQVGKTYYVPNAFSPNSDEFNNVFLPVFSLGFDASEYAMEIFNRWGELVFQTTNPADGWDGTYRGLECAAGVYTWKIITGKQKNAESVELNGCVTLLR